MRKTDWPRDPRSMIMKNSGSMKKTMTSPKVQSSERSGRDMIDSVSIEVVAPTQDGRREGNTAMATGLFKQRQSVHRGFLGRLISGTLTRRISKPGQPIVRWMLVVALTLAACLTGCVSEEESQRLDWLAMRRSTPLPTPKPDEGKAKRMQRLDWGARMVRNRDKPELPDERFFANVDHYVRLTLHPASLDVHPAERGYMVIIEMENRWWWQPQELGGDFCTSPEGEDLGHLAREFSDELCVWLRDMCAGRLSKVNTVRISWHDADNSTGTTAEYVVECELDPTFSMNHVVKDTASGKRWVTRPASSVPDAQR
jgi:hypothetical protein